jgi:hypothetical protein
MAFASVVKSIIGVLYALGAVSLLLSSQVPWRRIAFAATQPVIPLSGSVT